jgi:hypothetical protein
MLLAELGIDDLSNMPMTSKVRIKGKLVIEEASELAYLMAEESDLEEDPSQVKGDKVVIICPQLLDKVFDEIPPLIGGIYAYVLGAVLEGALSRQNDPLFIYCLKDISETKLYRDNGEMYAYSL